MAKKVKSFRLDAELIDEIAAYASGRKCSETEVIESAARSFLDLAKGGVPDLVEAKREAFEVCSSVPVRPAWTPPTGTQVEKAKAEFARGLALRQRGLNAAKERSS